MLNIARMGPGSENYYLDQVARGINDYYLGHDEAPGRWLGLGIDELELAGEVTGGHLSAVLAGEHPATGERLSGQPRKVPGFDLTFRAPKSVSLLWALAGPETSAAVQAAHDAAVEAAMGYIERTVARSRRGKGGGEQVQVDGVIAAGFRHRTSRAMDPLLHTHVLVANLVRTTDDGVWRTLDSRRLYLHGKTAGTLYQAHLRAELTRTLGVGWQPVVNGCADLAGVPRKWIDAFSKRRTAIVAAMQERGETSAAAAQVATLATRPAKQLQPDEVELRARWQTEAATHGIEPGWWPPLLHQQDLALPDHRALHRQLVAGEGLTADSSSFSQRDLVRTVAERLPDGATVEQIEAISGWLLEAGRRDGDVVELGPRAGGLVEVIRRTDGRLVDASGVDGRFTTAGLLLLEQTTINATLRRTRDQTGVVDPAVVEAVLRRRPTLGDDQEAMLRRLTGDGGGVAVVVGKAGTGKTYALDAARDAWTTAGIRTSGVALAARAALELQDSAGIPSTTLTRLLHQLDDPSAHGSPLQAGQVLVLDEAGMIGTRPLARLLAHAERLDVKVVLVGDPHQLPEVDAGGLFTALTRRLPAIELTDNRRQAHEWEQATLDQLRHGNVHDAVTTYSEHGRLVSADTAEEVRERLVSDWWHTYDHLSADTSIMVALRKADVADLNARARTRLRVAGRLSGPTLDVDGTQFQAGDRIVCLRNDYRAGLVNGLTATVTKVRDDHGLDVLDDDGLRLTIRADYIDAGHVSHGYAITGHKAQGLTVDHTYVLGSDALYREWGYVAMSRGRQTNKLYAHTTDDLEPDAHISPPSTDPVAATVTRLSRSRAQQPVSDGTAARWRDLTRWLNSDDVRQQSHVVAGLRRKTDERAAVVARLETLAATEASWLGPALTRTTRDHRAHVTAEIARQTDRQRRLEVELDALRRRLSALPAGDRISRARQEHSRLTETLRERTNRRLALVMAEPPNYLLTTIGSPPTQSAGRTRWQLAAHAIEQYRVHWDVTHPDLPLGETPTTPDQCQAHRRAVTQLDRATRVPERHHVREPAIGLGL